MGFTDLIIYSIVTVLVGLPVWWWWKDRRRHLDPFRYDVQVSKPENRSSIHRIERRH